MKYSVFVVDEAEEDIYDIYRYILVNDSVTNADRVFEKLQDACESLSEMPDRGHFVPELERIGVFEFREIHFKPYRIIYQTLSKKVFVHCVFDGRRDLQEILERRLLR